MSGWNQPTKPQSMPSTKKAPAWQRGALAGLVVVIAGIAALYFLKPSEETVAEKTEKKSAAIKEVEPAKAKKTAAQIEKEAHPGMVKVRGKWYPEYNEKGGKIWVTKNWVRYHSPEVYTNSSNVANEPEACKLFDNPVDKHIAELITMPLGTTIIGEWKFDERFTKRFLESLKTPIVVTAEDDEWAAEVKRSVTATKIELKERYDAGEDIGQIMTDTRKRLQDLGVYKMNLQQNVRELQKNAKGDAEQLKGIYDAANKMLAERGIEPLRLPTVLRGNLMLQNTKRKEKK